MMSKWASRERWHFEFFIQGIPAPGGSKNAFVRRDRKTGKIIFRAGTNIPVIDMVDAGKGNANWKKVVAATCKQKWLGKPIACPCIVECQFYLPRPAYHFGTGRNRDILKDSAPEFHTSAPDASKLRRSTEDAMTGIVYQDDALIVDGSQRKEWCGPGQKPGCIVIVRAL